VRRQSHRPVVGVVRLVVERYLDGHLVADGEERLWKRR
jgi:hypothetical protein